MSLDIILLEYPTLFNTVKYAMWACLLWLCTAALSGCGVKAGGFVAGSTGYLREANRALEIETQAAPKNPGRRAKWQQK